MNLLKQFPGLKKRCPDAWNAFYQQYQPRLFSFALLRLGKRDLHVAEDLEQETFIIVCKEIDRMEELFLAFLYKVLLRLIYGHSRRKQRGGGTVRFSELGGKTEDGQSRSFDPPDKRKPPGPDVSVLPEWFSALMEKAGLTPDEKKVLRLRYIVGYSRKETAEILRCSVKTVTNRRNSAVEKLKEYFLKHPDEVIYVDSLN